MISHRVSSMLWGLLIAVVISCGPELARAQAVSDEPTNRVSTTDAASTTDAPSATDAAPTTKEVSQPYRNPETVALRSLVVPGWGQHVNGQHGKGWFLTSLAVVGILLGTETIQLGVLTGGRTENNLERDLGWFMYGGAVAWATIDGYLVAQRLNRENGYDLAHWPGPAPSTGPSFTFVRIGF